MEGRGGYYILSGLEKYLKLIYRKKVLVGIEKVVDESLLKRNIPASDSLSHLDTRPAMPPIKLLAGGIIYG